MDDMEFGRRLAVERDIEKNGIDKGQAANCNAGTIQYCCAFLLHFI